MSRHLFHSAVLLLLLMMCSGSGAASAEASNPRNGIIFKGGDLFNDPETENLVQAFGSFRAPSLVYVNGVVVATVEAHYTNTTDKKSCVSLAAKSMKCDGGEWTNGTAIVFDHYDVKIDRLLSPTTFVNGNNDETNALVGGYGKSTAPLTEVTGDGYWAPRIAAGGLIPHDDDDEEKKEFNWGIKSTSGVPYDIWGDYSTNPKRFKQFLGGGGAGIRMEEESRYVLPIQALTNDGKNVSLVILAKGFTYGWEFSNGTSDEGCIQPAVLEWKDKSLLMMTSCEDGSRRVYLSSTMGNRWTEEYDTLSRVWGNSLKRTGHGVQGGFVSATIDEQKVILVSQPVYSGEEGKQETGRLHLWLTDMQRIHDVGPISAENENVAASTLLYATAEAPSLEGEEEKEEKKLYCSYEVAAAEDGKYNIAFVDLTEKLEDMRKVLAAWKEKDAQIAKEYGCGNEKDANERRDCDDGDLTKGLVGLLSNKSTKSTWADEYLCVNATVHGKVESTPDGGLTFKGPGAWAEWPVGGMGQNVPYHFANSRFTLVATVSIDKAPETGSSPIPLMGVRMNDAQGTVLFGLSYTHDKKWRIIFNGSRLTLPAHDENAGWEANTKYHVVLQMDYNNGLFVYVDGKRICDTDDYEVEDIYKSFSHKLQKLLSSHSISHFYIGGDGKSNSGNVHVTVCNVLLYNRLLKDNELNPLKKRNVAAAPEAEVSAPKGAPQNSHLSQPSEKDATPSPQKQDLSPEKSKNEKHSAGSGQAPSADPAGSSTSAAEGKVEDVASGSVGSASSFSPTAGEDSPQKARETDVSSGEDHFESEQEHSSLSVVQPMTEQAEEVVVATPQRKTTEERPQHSTLSDASEDVEESSFHSAPLTSDEQTVDPEERKDTNPHTAVGASSGPDSFHSTEVTPVDGATAAHEPSTDPETAQGHDEVLDGDDAAPGNTSTAPGKNKIPSESNATSLSEHGILLENGQFDLSAMTLIGDSTVHGCVSRVLLLLLLGLWGTAALC
ncbi:trans-sialidase, putative [Trypanosoma cruzi]|uniref:Trans-sialidase, putative n=1 Tax=Trypanosoma cruzi (strain CL Brener) TaxID=353153 RepID=Q4DFP2_TRYCC|nr:trans-sialidase, putative [Trypanosoma cruzi]EAN91337.1 trans-sialidase, putative [Trypanosoma cruzi]|eukprot:XP_813188.1 trans-sialidase [Trypanosoma cruzi strain CL Brener]